MSVRFEVHAASREEAIAKAEVVQDKLTEVLEKAEPEGGELVIDSVNRTSAKD